MEYANRSVMRNLGSLRHEDFEGASVPYVPTTEKINAVAPELNQKVQNAKRALAAVAIAVNGANEHIATVEAATDSANQPTRIPGISNEVLDYLDKLDNWSAPVEKSEYVMEAEQRIAIVLNQFDAIDDGTPRRLVQREYREHQSGQAGYNKEIRKVTHQVLRKVNDVYAFETTTWESSDWRAITKTKSTTDHVYFSRNADGTFSSAVRMRADTDGALVSTRITEAAALKPASVASESYDLSRFMKAYLVQQRMSPILSLLEELPDVYGPRNRYSGLSYDRHRNLASEYRFKDDGNDIEIAVYREVGSETKMPTMLSFYRDGKHNPEVWVDCDEWRIHVAKDYRDETPKADTSIIEEVKAKLHELVIKQGNAA